MTKQIYTVQLRYKDDEFDCWEDRPVLETLSLEPELLHEYAAVLFHIWDEAEEIRFCLKDGYNGKYFTRWMVEDETVSS